jgi:hypothetical protein
MSLDSDGGMILTGKNRRTRRKTCPSATLSTTNPTQIDPGANPGFRGERPATNDLSHGTAYTNHYINHYISLFYDAKNFLVSVLGSYQTISQWLQWSHNVTMWASLLFLGRVLIWRTTPCRRSVWRLVLHPSLRTGRDVLQLAPWHAAAQHGASSACGLEVTARSCECCALYQKSPAAGNDSHPVLGVWAGVNNSATWNIAIFKYLGTTLTDVARTKRLTAD